MCSNGEESAWTCAVHYQLWYKRGVFYWKGWVLAPGVLVTAHLPIVQHVSSLFWLFFIQFHLSNTRVPHFQVPSKKKNFFFSTKYFSEWKSCKFKKKFPFLHHHTKSAQWISVIPYQKWRLQGRNRKFDMFSPKNISNIYIYSINS